jgi:hypothetical protein
MSAPAASNVRVPDDSGNTGKRVRTQTRVVGADTVHEHFFVPSSPHNRLGSFMCSPVQQSVAAAAQNATSTGFLWLQLPAGSAVDAIVRAFSIEYNASAATAMPTAPVIALARFTFSGTASGAAVTPAKSRSSEASNVLQVRSAMTGMTVSLGANVASSSVPSLATAVGIYGLKDWLVQEGRDLEANDIRLAPGEGLVLYQTVAGTASDVRRFTCDIKWDEVDNT